MIKENWGETYCAWRDEMITSNEINKIFKEVLTPVLKKNGFTKTEARKSFGWHDECIWLFKYEVTEDIKRAFLSEGVIFLKGKSNKQDILKEKEDREKLRYEIENKFAKGYGK